MLSLTPTLLAQFQTNHAHHASPEGTPKSVGPFPTCAAAQAAISTASSFDVGQLAQPAASALRGANVNALSSKQRVNAKHSARFIVLRPSFLLFVDKIVYNLIFKEPVHFFRAYKLFIRLLCKFIRNFSARPFCAEKCTLLNSSIISNPYKKVNKTGAFLEFFLKSTRFRSVFNKIFRFYSSPPPSARRALKKDREGKRRQAARAGSRRWRR